MKMIIHGIEINPGLLNACITRMEAKPFKHADIQAAALYHTLLIDRDVAWRVADRLIQHFRKQGKIKLTKPFPTWEWRK